MAEEPKRPRLVQEPRTSELQMVNRGDGSGDFAERRKGLDSIPSVPPPVGAQAAKDAAAKQSDGAGTGAALPDYDG